MISTLRGLTHENVEKMAHKIFNAPNHLKFLVGPTQKVLCKITFSKTIIGLEKMLYWFLLLGIIWDLFFNVI